jgi:hypothetical protein
MMAYLLPVLEIIASSLFDMAHELNFSEIVLIFCLVSLLQQAEVVYLRLHNGNLALGIIELVAKDIDFFRSSIELDIGEAIV